MMRRLFRNTVISGISFGVTSLLGLIVVPIIIATWGLSAFGLIVLARAFLPTGALAVVDLGASEITTDLTARARASAEWKKASQAAGFLLVWTSIVGLVVAVALTLCVPWLVPLFRVPVDEVAGFQIIIYSTAAACLILFPSLVAEGVVKGFERFLILRLLDIASAAIYAVGTVVAAFAQASFAWVAIIFLVGNVLRCAAIWFVGMQSAQRAGLRFKFPAPGYRRTMYWRCWIMTQSKIAGAIQGPLLPLLVGAFFGARAAGLYDVLVRLPRFAKTILSILNASLLPVSAGIQERGRQDQMRRLARAGLVILPAINVPPLVAAAIFAEPILRFWIGKEVSAYAPWMSIMFAVPVVAQYLSFGNVIMLSRPHVLRTLNRIAMLQAAVMAVLVAVTAAFFHEQAFILGQSLAWILLLPWQLQVLGRELGINRAEIAGNFAIQVAIMAPCAAAGWMFLNNVRLENVVGLGIIFAIWCSIVWLAQYLVLLDGEARREVRLMAQWLMGFGRRDTLPG